MNERANTYNPKAEAARINRKLVRARSRRRVVFSSLALFALVFTLLSFRLTAGLDPSTGTTVATTSTPSTQSTTTSTSGDESASDTSSESADDESTSAATQSSSAGSTTSSQSTTAAPTTGAS